MSSQLYILRTTCNFHYCAGQLDCDGREGRKREKSRKGSGGRRNEVGKEEEGEWGVGGRGGRRRKKSRRGSEGGGRGSIVLEYEC